MRGYRRGSEKGRGGGGGGGSNRRRGWILNMLGQMHRPTVVCHSYSAVSLFPFLLHLVLSFLLLHSGRYSSSLCIQAPVCRPCSLLLSFPFFFFFPAMQLVCSVLHAPQEFTYSRVPARPLFRDTCIRLRKVVI